MWAQEHLKDLCVSCLKMEESYMFLYFVECLMHFFAEIRGAQ